MPGLFIDTWGWIALLDKRDEGHMEVEQLLKGALGTSLPVLTSWPVVSELLTFAASKRGQSTWGTERAGRIIRPLLENLDDREIIREVINPTDEQWREAMRLRPKHRSIGDLSLVDCSISVLCQARGIADVLSGDEHLRVVFPGVRLLPKDAA